MNALFSLYVWIAWVFFLLIFGPPAIVLLAIARPVGFRYVQAFARIGLGLAGIRVRVRGSEHVEWSRAHVFMGNHQNLLDPFILVLTIPRPMVGIEKRENLRIPVYGWLVRLWGNIPIAREDPVLARETIALATERLKSGESIWIMPEGTRTLTGAIGPFKKGGFHLAVDAGADIVPFTLNGAFERLQTGRWRIHPGVVEVVFDQAIPTEGVDKAHLDDLIARVRERVLANFTRQA
ncbi:MAG TPA: lysophospholipid acyltransferase family protein [Oscillatoriaceae cyanobacterium]